jgi:spermidine/putrescine transport system ATP-binding protein
MSGSLVRIEGAVKRFGDVAAVDGVDLDLGSGEFFALLGPSGCGKSTLLRMIGGFEVPTAGRILIDGVDMAGAPPHRRPVNTVFQSYALFPHMTVAQNIAYGLKAQGTPRAERDAEVSRILGQMRLDGLSERRPDALSGGQRQRVALARALVKRPKVLLLDEPLSALDAKLREQLRAELKRVHQEVGVTFLMVTHDQSEALALADRVAVMDKGSLEQVGAPADLYERPATRFVADFIGQVNLFGGRVAEIAPDRVAVDCPELAARVVVRRPSDARLGEPGWIALRPEHILMSRGGEGLEAVVGQATYLGGAFLYEVTLPGGRAVRVRRPHGPEADVYGPGDPVVLSWLQGAPAILMR